MLVDDKQAREKTAADDLRWLIAYSNDCKLSNQRLEEIATLIESLSAQVAELKHHLAPAGYQEDASYDDEIYEVMTEFNDEIGSIAHELIQSRAQVAELKKDAERLTDSLRDMEEGYRERCEYCGGVVRVCQNLLAISHIPCRAQDARATLDAAKESGNG